MSPLESVVAALRAKPEDQYAVKSDCGRDGNHFVALAARIGGVIHSGILELSNRPGIGWMIDAVLDAACRGADMKAAAAEAFARDAAGTALTVEVPSIKALRSEAREVEFGKKQRASQRALAAT